MRLRISILLVVALGVVQPSGAQLIPLKSTATPTGDQFFFLPSANLGMAGLGIARDDPLRDPFRNPALSSGVPLVRLTVSPVVYHNTLGTLGGRTVPVSGTLAHAGWFAAFAWATQELDDDPIQVFGRPTQVRGSVVEDEERTNTYLLGSVGRRFATGTSLGVQLVRGDLGLLDGTRRLYPESLGVLQRGELEGFTLGLAQDLAAGRTVEATLSRTRIDMENEVVRWRRVEPATPGGSNVEVRTEADQDVSRTLEGRIRYTQPLEAFGLRVGVVLGAMDRVQEETPRYDFVNIPRDPGSTRMVQIGLGAETLGDGLLLAWELSFHPGSSDTRARADSTYLAPSGATVRPGDPAIDSHFSFRNWRLAGGVQMPLGVATFQAGMAVHRYGFTLTQRDHLFEMTRERSESWAELLPSASARVALGPVDLGYSVRIATRGSAPCRDFSFRNRCRAEAESLWDTELVVAPTDPAHTPDFRVTTHHVTVSVRVGG